jgi:hypothetical protein
MKSAATGTASGCVVWMLVFCMLSFCVLTLALPLGSIVSTVSGDFVVRVVEPYLCPPGSTGEIITFATTTVDSNGVRQPATGYEMQCVDASGSIVRAPSPDYAFLWLGILAVIGLVLAALFAFLFAAPAGVLVAKLVNLLRQRRAG